MKDLKSGYIFLSVLLMIALSGTFAVAEYHYVNDCTVCHYSGSQEDSEGCNNCPNIKHVRCEISGLGAVTFPPYVRGEEPYDGVCEVCHELWDGENGTKYYTNDGLGDPHPEYQPGLGGPGTDCMLCHKHAPYEFGHEATVGSGCEPCHGQDGGPGTAFSHATHTKGDIPRGPATAMECGDCHNTNNYPLFGEGEVKQSLDETDACDNCHSSGGAYDGIAMAKDSWGSGVYSVDGTTLKSDKEDWCATCHDDDGPTINGRTAKNVSGDGSVYGYFISGHGNYGVSCTDCHDPGLTHIDAYARTYHAEEGVTNPSRNYRNGYRLALMNGGDTPLVVPRTEDYDSSHFALCYKCHRENVVVGGGNHTVGSGSSSIPYGTEPLQTYFAQLVEPYQGTSMWDDPPNNIHTEIHLDNWYCWDSDLRGERWDSAPSCPSCHDPHSSSAYQNRATHSMTRADLGIVYRREIMGWSAWPNTDERSVQGGDLSGCDMCHGQGDHGPSQRYYFMLGTALAEDETPAFHTGLDEGYDITNPQNGERGTLLGGSFAPYERNEIIRTGLLIENANEGCSFPVSNLNTDHDVIDFWYVPTFNFSENSENHCLVEVFSSASNYLRIEVRADNTLLFSIYNGTLHSVKSNVLYWTADTAHHIRCTWGLYGMHMYLDRGLEEYSVDSGIDYLGGINGTGLPDDFFIGRRNDEQEPANGIIDNVKIYGYQYQKFEQPLALFSRLGTLDEVENPDRGTGGAIAGNVNFFNEGDTAGPDNGPWVYSQHGYSVGIYDDEYLGVYNGVIGFPTSNLRRDEDTIDFWWGPMFSVASNTGARVLFYCAIGNVNIYDEDDLWGIRVYYDRLHFIIVENGQTHELYTAPIQDFCYNSGDVRNGGWYHVVCSWGPEGMHIYINDQEAVYDPLYDSGTGYQGGLGTLPDWFMIGNTVAGGASHMDSMMDELRIYGYQPETSFPQKPQKSKDHAF